MGNWTVHEWPEASSTNDLARSLTPWSIARCDVQTSGRGRFNRPWIGAKGGLWVSFTVPLHDPGRTDWGQLPLLAGLALIDCLRSFNIQNARLRWPNDVLVGNSKLAGILVERPSKDMAIIGIGVNIANDVDALYGITKDPAISIGKLLSPCPDISDILKVLSQKIESRFLSFTQGGLAAISEDLKQAWMIYKEVTIQTDAGDMTGVFCGIDPSGNPAIKEKNGKITTISGHLINRLIENH